MAMLKRKEAEIPALSGDTPLSDSSVSPANGEPVFSGPQWDTTENESGAPLTLTEEINRARKLESERIITARQFIGAHPTAIGGLPQEDQQPELSQQTAQQNQQATTPNAEEEEDAAEMMAEDKDMRAMEMATLQSQARKRSLQEAAQQAEKAANAVQAVAETTAAGIRTASVIGQLAASPTIIPLVTLFGQLNFQLLYEYFLKNAFGKKIDTLLKPSFPQRVGTMGMNCAALGCCPCGCAFPIALIIAVIFGVANLIPGLTSLLEFIL